MEVEGSKAMFVVDNSMVQIIPKIPKDFNKQFSILYIGEKDQESDQKYVLLKEDEAIYKAKLGLSFRFIPREPMTGERIAHTNVGKVEIN